MISRFVMGLRKWITSTEENSDGESEEEHRSLSSADNTESRVISQTTLTGVAGGTVTDSTVAGHLHVGDVYNMYNIENGPERHLSSRHDRGVGTVIYNRKENMLLEACRGGRVEVVRSLLSTRTINIESRGEEGVTPVMVAAREGHEELFNFLVKKGCDLYVVLHNGNSILHEACLGGSVEIVTHILSAGVVDIDKKGQWGRTPVINAANRGQKEIFDLLVSKGSDLSIVADNGVNILHVACLSYNVDIVDYIVNHKIPNIECKAEYDRTPVMYAAFKGSKNVFDFLVKRGSDLSVMDTHNILHIALLGGNVSIVENLLTHHKVDINSRNNKGTTPLKLAKNRERSAVVKLLRQRGALET